MYRVLIALLLFSTSSWAVMDAFDADDSYLQFQDQPLEEPLDFPAWFKLSFLNLTEDLAEAETAGKVGIIIYYGQKYCAYCKQFLEKDLALEDIQNYMLEHYDVIGIDIHGQRAVTHFEGVNQDEQQFAEREQTNFTPTFVNKKTEGE